MESILADLRYGLRMLTRQPTVTGIIVVTLAFSMGSVSAVFTLVNALLFPTMVAEAPDELAFLWSANQERNIVRGLISKPNFRDLGEQLSSLQGMAAYRFGRVDLTGGEQPLRLAAWNVTPNFFHLMGYHPAQGRLFEPDGDGVGEVVLGHAFWQSELGADPRALGRALTIDGKSYVVVGIAAADLEAGMFRETDLWLALPPDEGAAARDVRRFQVVGRLRSEASFKQLEAELTAVTARLQRDHPAANAGWRYLALRRTEQMVARNVRLILGMLGFMVAVVLLLACANVANLMLARAAEREREIALRSAFGARRRRLARQFLTENLMLSVVSGLAALAVTWGILRVLATVTRSRVRLFAELAIDRDVFLFAFALILLVPLVFGLAPMVRASNPHLAVLLNELSTRSGGRSRDLSRGALTTLQVALSMVLLVLAVLIVRTTLALKRIETGYDENRVLTLLVDRPVTRAEDDEEVRNYFRSVERYLGELSGVRGTAIASRRPLIGSGARRSVSIAGQPEADPSQLPWFANIIVGVGYFDTLGIALLRGRVPNSGDTATATPVAVVSRAAAERYWPDGDPLNDRLRIVVEDGEEPWIEIVGVVGDVRNSDADQPPEPILYLPFEQRPSSYMSVFVRTETDPQVMSESVRQAVWKADPDQPLEDMRTLLQIRFDRFAAVFAINFLMVFFAGLSLVLAAGGLYSVVSYAVRQRFREIGVRRALGASGRDVMRLSLRRSLGALVVGLVAGALLAVVLGGVIGGVLYGVEPSDPPTFLGAAVLLFAVSLAAGVIPARRALRIDPATVLRYD